MQHSFFLTKQVRKALFWGAILSVISWVGLVGLKTIFVITEVQCQSQNSPQPCPEALQAQLQTTTLHTSMFLVQVASLRSITRSYQLELVSIKKRLPHTLIITVVPQSAQLAVITADQRQFWYIQGHFQLASNSAQTELPTFTLATQTDPNTLTAADQQALLTLAETLPLSLDWTNLAIRYYHPHHAEFSGEDTITVIFDPTQASSQLARWDFLSRQLSSLDRSSQLNKLDLRFKLPVLTNDDLRSAPLNASSSSGSAVLQ
jgi:cell division septal protein FtsQ